LCDGAQIAIFDEFLRPVFAASRVHHVSDLHLKFAQEATPCVEAWQTSNLRPLRLGEEKKERRRKNKQQDENIYGLPYYIGRP